MNTTTAAALGAALEYACLGWPVFPLHTPTETGCSCRKPGCKDIGKHPRTKNGLRDATTNEATIRAWWQQWPEANVGIRTGPESGLLVLDAEAGGGMDTVQRFEEEHGLLPPTPVVQTGGGGMHAYFAYPPGGARNSAKKVALGVDIRAGGGYVVAPPSLHASGRRYTWLDDLRTPVPPPPWFLGIIAAAGRASTAKNGTGDDGEPIAEGERNDALASIAGRMRWAGLKVEEIIDVLQRVNKERCEPPLPEDEVEAIARSIGRYPAGDDRTEHHAGHKNGSGPHVDRAGLTRDDFVAYLAPHKYIYRATGDLWSRTGVNAAVPPILIGRDEKGKEQWTPASDWLDTNAPVHQLTWAPGEPEIITGRLINQGGWIEDEAARAYNLYRPPIIALGDPERADPWLEHVYRLYPDHAEHIVAWLAYRVQRPADKINHALLLGGVQGCGKDTILRPVRDAVGPWNFLDASPSQVMGRFNGFLKSVILLVPELNDLGDVNRYTFYEHMKPIIAAPPMVLRCDEKFIQETSVPNVTGVIFTSNHRIGIHLPVGDRRHFASWSEVEPASLSAGYFDRIYRWLDDEHGTEHVAAFLQTLDLADFHPNAPPPKTEWFWAIVEASRAPEESELSTLLDSGAGGWTKDAWPVALTIDMLVSAEQERVGFMSENDRNSFLAWLQDRKNRRQIPHRLEAVGYTAVRNAAANDGLWVVNKKRMAIYAKRDESAQQRLEAARTLVASWGGNR